MDEVDLLWSAGRDLALLRRSANPVVPQTETFNNIALLRRLFLEGAIHAYWKHLRPEASTKFQIEYTYIHADRIASDYYLLVLTGDQWSDLLLAGKLGNHVSLYNVHAEMMVGTINQHLNTSTVLSSDEFRFTPADIIKYHAYTLGEVHLNAKEQRRVIAYDDLLRCDASKQIVNFGNNGPASLALKGFLSRITRSDAFRFMFQKSAKAGYIPTDVVYPTIPAFGLQERLRQSEYDSVGISLRYTQKALERNISSNFPRLDAVLSGRRLNLRDRIKMIVIKLNSQFIQFRQRLKDRIIL